MLPGLEPDGKLIWTYFEAMVPTRIPKSLIVIGSGAIGVEFASFYPTLGAEVTLVEVLPQILPAEDAEIAAHARKRFEKQGIKILTSTKVDEGREAAERRRRHRDEDEKGATQTLAAERMISAVGVRAMSKISGSKRSASKPSAASSSPTASAAPMCRHLCHRRCRGAADARA